LSDDIDLQAQERVGALLNEKWTLERLLGVGGMAAVYEGRHRNGARAAIKVLHPGLSRHADVRERFLREGYAANKVEHEGVVKVMDDDVVQSGPDQGTAYIVMELLDGESLQDRLERGPPLTESEFLGIAAEVLEVLDAAHARGVVHRDLKPENLFLASAPSSRQSDSAERAATRVKVLDFGLARLLDGATITSHGLALGTPSFMSPEQAAGRIEEIDGRTDLFALGATGFRVRTGRRIQEGANAVELVTKMANFAAPRIRSMAPEVSEPYARVIDRALEFKREDRYPDAATMRDDVRKALSELDGQARTVIAVPASASLGSPAPVSVRGPLPSASSSMPAPRASHLEREDTIELSGSDLDVATPPPGPPPASPPRSESSLPVITPEPRRRRRSMLPWMTLTVLAAIGGKVAWDARAAAVEATPAASSIAPVVPVTSAPVASSASIATSTRAPTPTPTTTSNPIVARTPPSPSAAPPVMAAHPSPLPAAATSRPRPPPRPGPGNVHVLKRHK
jgi:serine/threonine-protein kinase